ncbi:MAG: leucine-rich repeat domain-containing protein [Anaeroplasmataceae bacterium]
MKLKTILICILSCVLLLTSCGKEGNKFMYKVENDEAILIQTAGGINDLTIPEEHIGYKVTKIEEYAFYISAVVNLNLSTNLREIGNYAFQSSFELLTIHIPEDSNLETIGGWAFSGCDLLGEVELYNAKNLKTIGPKAFQNCPELKEIFIPANVTTIGANAFYGCSNLVIRLEATEIPSGFDELWNSSNCEVRLGEKYIKE